MVNIENVYEPFENPTAEDWLILHHLEGDQTAITELFRLVLKLLRFGCKNPQINDFELNGLIDIENCDVEQFTRNMIARKEFDLSILHEFSDSLSEYMEDIIEHSEDFEWIKIIAQLFLRLAKHCETVFLIEKPIIGSYIALLNKHSPFCADFAQIITQKHVIAFSARVRIGLRFVDELSVNPQLIRNDVNCILMFAMFLSHNHLELLEKLLNTAIKAIDHHLDLIPIFLNKSLIDALDLILDANHHVTSLKLAYTLAIKIQKANPMRKLFKSHAFQDFLSVNSDSAIQKLAAELFMTMFTNPNAPNSTECLNQIVIFYEKHMESEHSVNQMVKSFWSFNLFTDWTKVFSITLNAWNKPKYLNTLWHHIMNETLGLIKSEQNAEEQLQSFLHAGIEFVSSPNTQQRRNLFGLVISFINRFDKMLQFVNDEHQQMLAQAIQEFLVHHCCVSFEDQSRVVSVLVILMERNKIDAHYADQMISDLLAEHIFDQVIEFLNVANFDLNTQPQLLDKFLVLAAFAENGLLKNYTEAVHQPALDLCYQFFDVNLNQDFWSHVIIIFIRSCIDANVQKTFPLGEIQLSMLSFIRIVKLKIQQLMTNGQMDLLVNSVFTSLCKIGFIDQELGPMLVDFLNEKIKLYARLQQDPASFDYDFNYFESMFEAIFWFLQKKPELFVEKLVVTAFYAFPSKEYVYDLLKVLVERDSFESFVECAIAVLSTYPPHCKIFEKRIDKIIEDIPSDDKRMQLRIEFTTRVIGRFGRNTSQQLDESSKRKTIAMSKSINKTIIQPHLQEVLAYQRQNNNEI